MNLERLREFQVLGDYEIRNPRIRKLVEHVIARIPDECEAEFPVLNVVESAKIKTSSLGGVSGDDPDETWICLPAEKLDHESPDNDGPIVGVIAHEFAHAFLRHASETSELYARGGVFRYCDHELSANVLATKWGFGQEIKVAKERFGNDRLSDRDTYVCVPGKIRMDKNNEGQNEN